MKNEWKQFCKENNTRQSRLREKDQDVLDDVLSYLKSTNRNPYDLEVLRKDLIGMAEEAQDRNESLEDVIGPDRKEFCEGLAETLRHCSFRDWILFMAPSASLAGLVILSFCVRPRNLPFFIQIDIGFLMFALFWEIYFGMLCWAYQLNRFHAWKKNPNYKVLWLGAITLPVAIVVSRWISLLSQGFIYTAPVISVILLPWGLYLLLRWRRELRITQLAQESPWKDGAKPSCE